MCALIEHDIELAPGIRATSIDDEMLVAAARADMDAQPVDLAGKARLEHRDAALGLAGRNRVLVPLGKLHRIRRGQPVAVGIAPFLVARAGKGERRAHAAPS